MRENLIRKRERKGLSREAMAKRCRCSPALIFGIEELDWITHPDIASRLAKEYGFGVRTYNQLVHEDRHVKELPAPVMPPDDSWIGFEAYAHGRSRKTFI